MLFFTFSFCWRVCYYSWFLFVYFLIICLFVYLHVYLKRTFFSSCCNIKVWTDEKCWKGEISRSRYRKQTILPTVDSPVKIGICRQISKTYYYLSEWKSLSDHFHCGNNTSWRPKRLELAALSALHSSFLPSQTMGAAEKIICNILDTHAHTHISTHKKQEKKLIYGLQKMCESRANKKQRLRQIKNYKKSEKVVFLKQTAFLTSGNSAVIVV